MERFYADSTAVPVAPTTHVVAPTPVVSVPPTATLVAPAPAPAPAPVPVPVSVPVATPVAIVKKEDPNLKPKLVVSNASPSPSSSPSANVSNEGSVWKTISISVWVIIGLYAAYTSWSCNSQSGIKTSFKIVYAIFAFLGNAMYLFYYMIFRAGYCECKPAANSIAVINYPSDAFNTPVIEPMFPGLLPTSKVAPALAPVSVSVGGNVSRKTKESMNSFRKMLRKHMTK
jgi:hypothetical protein